MGEEIQDSCRLCGGHITYARKSGGKVIRCPHCEQEIILGDHRLGGQPRLVPKLPSVPSVECVIPKVSRFNPSRIIAAAAALLVLVTLIAGRVIIFQKKKAETQHQAEVDRITIENEHRIKKEQAKAEVDAQKLKAEQEAATAAAKTIKDAKLAAAAENARIEAAQKALRLAEITARVKQNPKLAALWEERDHEAIRIVSTRPNDATINHNGRSFMAKYEDLPEWLRIRAQTKYKDEGEAKGQIREVDGKIYDLRTSPGGWVALPLAEVFQIVDNGYLLIDSVSLNSAYAQNKVFKLKHNGFSRILNTGDRIQITAMSVGTYTYETKENEIKTVPLYDLGMPVGPLRATVVTFDGSSVAGATKKREPSQTEPSSSGSGFFISDDGLFITNAHVVKDSVKIEVITAAGKKQATVLCIDEDKDLALLRVSVGVGTVSGLSISMNNLPLGASAFTIGYPLISVQGFAPKYTDGKISSLSGYQDDPDQIQISVAIQPGNSGGPLADVNGDIAGVIVSQLGVLAKRRIVPQNVNYAIKGATLVRFLNENKTLTSGVKFGKSQQRTMDEAIKTVEKASGLVLVY